MKIFSGGEEFKTLWQRSQYEQEQFMQWVMGQPALRRRVLAALVCLRRLEGGVCDGWERVSDLLYVRDAADALRMAACDGGFPLLVDLFGMLYDASCRGMLWQMRRVWERGGSEGEEKP